MSKTYSTSQPLANLLYQDDQIVVTTGRIEMLENSCATKYVSSITLHEHLPSRIHGWTGIAACVVASLALLLYLYTGKISVGVYIVAYLLVAVVAILVTVRLLLAPARYKIDFTLINGQSFEIHHRSALQIREIHAAIKEAVARNRQDPLAVDTIDPMAMPYQAGQQPNLRPNQQPNQQPGLQPQPSAEAGQEQQSATGRFGSALIGLGLNRPSRKVN